MATSLGDSGIVGYVCGLREISEVFGLSKQAVQKWRDRGMPTIREKPTVQVRLPDVLQWREAEWTQRLSDVRDETAADSGDEFDRRFRKARAEKIEIENARTRAELLPVANVTDLLEQMDTMTIRALRNLEKNLPPIVTPLTDERNCAHEINRIVEDAIEDRGRMQREWFENMQREINKSRKALDNGSMDQREPIGD